MQIICQKLIKASAILDSYLNIEKKCHSYCKKLDVRTNLIIGTTIYEELGTYMAEVENYERSVSRLQQGSMGTARLVCLP